MLVTHKIRPPVVSWLALVGLSVLSLWSPTVRAQAGKSRSPLPPTDGEQAEARTRYARGLQMVREENYQAALIEMQRAYSLSPSYKILYNLGHIENHLGDAAAAVGSYERYLSEGGADVPPPRALEVSQEIARLRSRVGSVELVVKGDGATVLVDDVVVGLSPYNKKILVNVGRHRFAASRPGAEPIARVVSVAGEDAITLELDASTRAATPKVRQSAELGPEESAPAAKHDDAMPPRRAVAVGVAQNQKSKPGNQTSGGSRLTWLGWAITGALAVGAAVAGYVAWSEAKDLGQLRDSPKATRAALDNAQASAFRAALVTDVLLGATVVAAGVSLYYTLVPGRSAAEAATGSTRGLQLTLSPYGAGVRGSF